MARLARLFRCGAFVAAACLFAPVATAQITSVPIPASERAVLLNIYNSTNGAGWHVTSKPSLGTYWGGPPGTECEWPGVGCMFAAPDGLPHISFVSLSGNNLTGTFPPIKGLPYLQLLHVADSDVGGPVPDVSGLAHLEEVILTNTRFSGPIPPLIGLPKLRVYRVGAYSNKPRTAISGNLPSVAGLSELEIFEVIGSALTGQIPPIAGLSKLYAFSVGRNELSGPIPPLQGLPSLHTFEAEENRLTGPIPPLSSLPSLTNLYLRKNRLSGRLPSLAGLASLQILWVSDNKLTGKIPSLSGLSALEYLHVDNNQLSGQFPSLAGLTNLRRIRAENNALSGPMAPRPGIDQMFVGSLPFGSNLCGNLLNSTGIASADHGWDEASGLGAVDGVPGWLACQVPRKVLFANPLNRALADAEYRTVDPTRLDEWSSAHAIAADGRSAAVVVYLSRAQSPVTFQASPAQRITKFHPNFLLGSSGGAASEVSPLRCEAGLCTFLALLWAPDEGLTLSGSLPRTPLTVSASQAGIAPVAGEIDLQPSPLALVHGIWSSAAEAAFVPGGGGLADWLVSRYPHASIRAIDYGRRLAGGAGRLSQQSYVDDRVQAQFRSDVHRLLVLAADSGLVARSADVFAHSMGGLVMRQFLGLPVSRPQLPPDPIHRIVTAGTPHAGTKLAGLLFDNVGNSPRSNGSGLTLRVFCKFAEITCTLGNVFAKQGKVVSGGVEALTPGNASLARLPGLADRMATAIVGISPYESDTENRLLTLVRGFVTDDPLATILGNAAHDTLVPYESQAGDSPHTIPIFDLVHTAIVDRDRSIGETGSLEVWRSMFAALTGLAAPSQSSMRAGESKVVASPPLLDLSGLTEVDASHLQVSPPPGATLAIGSTVTIKATSATKTLSQLQLFAAGGDALDPGLLYATGAPFEVTMAPRRTGTLTYVVIALFADNTYTALALQYEQALPIAPTTLLVDDSITLTPGMTYRFTVEAAAAGATVDVSDLAVYIRRNSTNVFSVGPSGEVTANVTGEGTLDISYGSLQASARVIVVNPPLVELGASVGQVSFGRQSMGTSSPVRTVTLTNATSAALTISSVGTSDAQFVASHDCSMLSPGGTCSVALTFKPAPANVGLNVSVEVNASLTATAASGSSLTIALSGVGEKSLVSHYYRSILRREPDPGGKTFWEGEARRVEQLGLNVNEAWFALSGTFFGSAEYVATNPSTTRYVEDLYTTYFARAADGGGLAYWSSQLAAGLPREILLTEFMFSPEFVQFARRIFGELAVRAEVDMVTDFYRGILSRLPDGSGFGHWVAKFRTAQCVGAAQVIAEVEAITKQFVGSTEYVARARTNAGFIGDMYNAFMRRGGDHAGVAHWIGQLDSSRQSRDEVRRAFVASPEFQARVHSVAAQGCLWPT